MRRMKYSPVLALLLFSAFAQAQEGVRIEDPNKLTCNYVPHTDMRYAVAAVNEGKLTISDYFYISHSSGGIFPKKKNLYVLKGIDIPLSFASHYWGSSYVADYHVKTELNKASMHGFAVDLAKNKYAACNKVLTRAQLENRAVFVDMDKGTLSVEGDDEPVVKSRRSVPAASGAEEPSENAGSTSAQ